MNWRKKRMTQSELAPLQEQFATYHRVMRDDPYLAMFTQKEPGSDAMTVYMTGPNITMLERHAPGGWEDSDAPSSADLNLLIGREDCWDRVGVRKPAGVN